MAQLSNSASSSCTEFEDKDSQSAAPAREIILTAPRNIMDNHEIAATLDRLKISDNLATMLISSFIKACNGDINDFCLSRSTTRRSRIASRFKISQKVLEKMKQNAPRNIALHWDGKLTTDRMGSKYEALSIIASGGSVSDFENGKLLGITKLESSTGRAQAHASYDILLMWQITNNLKALVFDTTSSNSGWKNGAAKLLEEQLGRKVFYHACRHHIYELVIRAVWKSIFGKETTGPENPIFNEFKKMGQHRQNKIIQDLKLFR